MAISAQESVCNTVSRRPPQARTAQQGYLKNTLTAELKMYILASVIYECGTHLWID